MGRAAAGVAEVIRAGIDPHAYTAAIFAGLTYEVHFTDRFGMSANVRSGVVHGINKTGSDTGLGLISQLGFFGRV